MAKQTITVIILLCFITTATAQQQLDVSYMECSYRLTFMKDTVAQIKTVKDADMRLLIGDKYSKFYSYMTFLGDSARNSVPYSTLMANNGALFGEYLNKYPQGERYEIYKNLTNNTLIFKDRLPDKVLYKEVVPKQNWIILNETKQIAGYKCQKATCRFRGRDYVAWFTREIPVSAGPWKFNGLPGLIVKIHDTKEHYDFELYSVKKIKKAIVFDKKDYQEVELKDHIQMNRNRLTNPLAGQDITFTREDGTPFKPNAKRHDVMERDIK